MARPNRSAERRSEFAPILARTFAELGYRRATTYELAERCGVQESSLFRLWPDKRAMFTAALDFVYASSEATWTRVLNEADDTRSAAEVLVDFEAVHQGEHGLYRIVFAGLSEADDPVIAEALRDLYARFHAFVRRVVARHRGGRGGPGASAIAWGLLGLGTLSNIGRELGHPSDAVRRRVFRDVGHALLDLDGPGMVPGRDPA